mmetsp:Transcript_85546/g.223178  ORF Transcript_85546/g.223178 Transcript_85546/m.223178 type:complete len:279 (-) Transcript_85546:506-1342(-)
MSHDVLEIANQVDRVVVVLPPEGPALRVQEPRLRRGLQHPLVICDLELAGGGAVRALDEAHVGLALWPLVAVRRDLVSALAPGLREDLLCPHAVHVELVQRIEICCCPAHLHGLQRAALRGMLLHGLDGDVRQALLQREQLVVAARVGDREERHQLNKHLCGRHVHEEAVHLLVLLGSGPLGREVRHLARVEFLDVAVHVRGPEADVVVHESIEVLHVASLLRHDLLELPHARGELVLRLAAVRRQAGEVQPEALEAAGLKTAQPALRGGEGGGPAAF